MDNMRIQKQIEITLQGQEYQLKMNSSDSLLYLELEAKYEAFIWKNTYTLDYIEELTRKTGNHRKFNVFTNMLATAISKTNEHVFFEILTFQDLENLKQQKLSESKQQQSSSQSALKSNKRYLILTYQTDFEKVHYPLALNYEEEIDSSKLITKMQFMKSELMDYKMKTSEDFQTSRDSFNRSKRDIHTADSIKSENELLRAKVKRLEDGQGQKRGAIEVDQLIRDNESLQMQLGSIKREADEKLLKSEQLINAKNSEMVMQMAELNALKRELTNLIGKVEVDKRIKDHIENMNHEEESQLVKANKTIIKLEKEIEGLNQTLDSQRKQDVVQKRRIAQLETEISQSMKKTSYKGVTDRLYSPYSNHSNGSRKSNQSMPNKVQVQSKPVSRNASPNLSKDSRNSTGNSASMNRNRMYGTSPTYKQVKPQQPTIFQKKPSPVRQNIVQRPASINNVASKSRASPIPQRQSPVNRPIQNKSPTPQRQNYQNTQQQPTRQRVTYSASHNYQSKPTTNNTKPIRNEYGNFQYANANDLDNKINNLKSLLQRAKK